MGGSFTVWDGSRTVECAGRGKTRKDGGLTVGDEVLFTENSGGGVIESVLPRTAYFKRPPVANADTLLVLMSPSPQPDLMLLDKLLVLALTAGVVPFICCGKSDDAAADALYADVTKAYGAAFEVLSVSAADGSGIAALCARLKGHCTVLAGQSASGKTSLLNALLPGLNLPVGGMSQKGGRGRHTTRHIQIYSLKNGGLVADTPGFSLLEIEQELSPEELQNRYPDFCAVAGDCRFATCTHNREPGCAVRAAAEGGTVDLDRYRRYVQLFAEIKENRQYD